MATWVLIFYVYANALSKSDSVAITNIPAFKTQQECMLAGSKAKEMVGGYKSADFVCVQQSK